MMVITNDRKLHKHQLKCVHQTKSRQIKSNTHNVKPDLLFTLLQQLLDLLTFYISKGTMAIFILQQWICSCTETHK